MRRSWEELLPWFKPPEKERRLPGGSRESARTLGQVAPRRGSAVRGLAAVLRREAFSAACGSRSELAPQQRGQR